MIAKWTGLLVALWLVGCKADETNHERGDGSNDTDSDVDTASDSSSGGGDADTDTDADGDSDAPLDTDSADNPYGKELFVYGHTATDLYKIDPTTFKSVHLAKFSGSCENQMVVDIAVNKDNVIYASAGDAIHKVDSATGLCFQVSAQGFGNNLSFVPIGVLDPQKEILVSYLINSYRSFDLETGVITTHGSLPDGTTVSGDIVSVQNGGTFVSVGRAGGGNSNLLLEINPATGEEIKDWGSLEHGAVYGLGFWAGIAYGFDANGDIFAIHFGADAISVELKDASGLPWWGAGSSTLAPPDVI